MEKLIDKQIAQDGSINLRGQKLGDPGLAIIISRSDRKILRISVPNNQITPLGIKQFSQSKWEHLVTLRIGNVKFERGKRTNEIGNIGCKYLSKTWMPSIILISLSSSKIGSEGLNHLSKANWKNIQSIFLNGNKIVFGLNWLIRSNWKGLKSINIIEIRSKSEQNSNLLLGEIDLTQLYLLPSQSQSEDDISFSKLEERLRQKYVNLAINK